MLGNLRQLTPSIGAEIAGMDLKSIDDDGVTAIQDAFLEHQVLFFPRQEMTADDLAGFARRFGTIDPPHGGLMPHPDNSDVMLVETKKQRGGGKYNDVWHSDVTFDHSPPLGSILRAVKLPDVGGDTLFASMYAAYDALSDRMRQMIEGLEALHDGIPNFRPYLLDPDTPNGEARLRMLKEEQPGCVHPVVRRHPQTGRKALFVNRAFTTDIMGVTSIESRNILNFLFEHIEQPNFQLRWRWSEGDVAMWDNRCALHYAANDYGDAHRVMHRVTLKGDKPVS
ncbi:MAG: TauD/TfdA family dioxygenase [Pseudomonadota bacterium]